MSVDSAQGPLRMQARVLPPPKLRYGAGSKQAIIVRLFVVMRGGLLNLFTDSKQWVLEYVRRLSD